MKQTIIAWLFRSSTPLPLTQALKRLGRDWTKHDSDYRLDSISGPITKSSWARIFQVSLTSFIIHLTVEVEHDADLDAVVSKAKEKLIRSVLPLLDAHEIKETSAEAVNDYMNGTGYYLS